MTSLNFAGTMILAVAEAAGAYWFFKTKNAGLRMLMTSFGFGFAFAIVLFDLLPDATEHYPTGYLLFALGALVMFAVWRSGKQRSRKTFTNGSGSVAVAGMALHNLGEGILFATMTGPISFLLVVGALLHKLPEGMATFAMLEGVKEKTRFTLAAAVGLMIPLGALVHFPNGLQQPLMALMSGMILVAVSTAIIEHSVKNLTLSVRWKVTAPYAMGALIGAVSCLIA
jgi:ZIP family zinc transporter